MQRTGNIVAHPAISVVMSVYNGEKHLREAVDSILAQTFTDIEFMIVNDGSTDGTREILESYQDERISLIHQDNMGLTKSLNSGIARARGAYVARQDADDISHPGRLAAQVEFLSNHPDIALVGSSVDVIDRNGRKMATFRHPCAPMETKETLMKYNCFWHGSVMFTRSGYLDVGGYDETFVTAQDYDLWLRFSERHSTANIPEPLYSYRFSTDSVTVRKMVSQHRMAALARRLAELRSEGCQDPHALARADEFLASPLTLEERAQIIRNYAPWCRLLLQNGLIDEAGRLMTELYRHHPSLLFRTMFFFGKHINPAVNLARFIEHA